MNKILMAERHSYKKSEYKIGCHHYAKLLSQQGYELLWLTPTYSHMYKFVDKKFYDCMKDVNNDNFVELDKNIYGYSPYSIVPYVNYPFLKSKVAAYLNVKLTVPNINKTLRNNKFDKVDILWLDFVKYYYLINTVKYKKLVYRCNDDLSGFKNMPKSMLDFEEKIIRKADVVFVTSKDLMEKKSHIRNDLVYLPNGVELDNFERVKYKLPREFQNNKKKCIYIGAIADWIDLDLIKYTALTLKDIDFYFIGHITIELDELKNIKNIKMLGTKPYEEIPNYLYFSDVAIIPFKINNLTNSISPVKLYEYMSLGLNVVTTDFKEMSYMKSPALISKDKNEFVNNIKLAIEKINFKNKNIEYAKKNAWQSRIEVIKQYLRG